MEKTISRSQRCICKLLAYLPNLARYPISSDMNKLYAMLLGNRCAMYIKGG